MIFFLEWHYSRLKPGQAIDIDRGELTENMPDVLDSMYDCVRTEDVEKAFFDFNRDHKDGDIQDRLNGRFTMRKHEEKEIERVERAEDGYRLVPPKVAGAHAEYTAILERD